MDVNKSYELNELSLRMRDESRKGDVRDACKEVGVTTTVYTSLRRRNTLDEATDAERKVYKELISILDARQKELEELKNHANQTGK